jgi:lipoprotein-releasing system permease protein
MYKFLLCWRYLRTRYIALASIISVMLGVATMIVVNSVMAGFTHEMQNRIQGILSDVILESRSLEGMPDFERHAADIRRVAGDQIEGVTPAVVVPAMLNFQYGGTWITRQVQLIGIDEKTQSSVSDFGTYLQHPRNREQMSFGLQDGFDTRDHNAEGDAPERAQLRDAGWEHRRQLARLQAFQQDMLQKDNRAKSAPATAEKPAAAAADPFAARRPPSTEQENLFDPAKEQHTGVVLGIAMASYRMHGSANAEDGKSGAMEERFVVVPGDDVKLTFSTAGQPPKAISDNFTVVDFYESKMAEYDSTFVFMPIRKLQELRGMIDPSTGVGLVNSIQIKLKPGVDGNEVRDKLRKAFPAELYVVSTWRDKQGALLAAVQMETAILNVLLFLIIAVAGFGILAIFYMIVVEKTRDIGILKSLGASGRGVMGIFLSYGLSLGCVGSGVGMAVGLLLVHYINHIADALGWITGHPVFNPEIYYFYKIPTIVLPATIAWIVVGAVAIAVLASILPARRAARFHPVEALRYE